MTAFLEALPGQQFSKGGIIEKLADLNELEKKAQLLKFSFADAAEASMTALIGALSKPLMAWVRVLVPSLHN